MRDISSGALFSREIMHNRFTQNGLTSLNVACITPNFVIRLNLCSTPSPLKTVLLSKATRTRVHLDVLFVFPVINVRYLLHCHRFVGLYLFNYIQLADGDGGQMPARSTTTCVFRELAVREII